MEPNVRIDEREEQLSCPSGVIWITGYSGAGKTTVARHVESLLRDRGLQAIFLDGDHLRSIFGGRWGYAKADRVELAHVYFRLCSHLAAQGFVVIIAAVAMYAEVRTWVRTYIPRSQMVYLEVPHEVRLQRDSETKHVYAGGQDMEGIYDEPVDPDLRIANHGDVSPVDAAATIVKAFLELDETVEPDRGRSEYWNAYYSATPGAQEPSPFAVAAASTMTAPVTVLEVGCGNGRDAAYLSSLGYMVVGLDASPAAVELCRHMHPDASVEFVAGTLPEHAAKWGQRFDVLYTRFVLHAMTEQDELDLWREARKVLRPGGRLMLECRSIQDPLAREGSVLSPTERVAGHYRRFIVLEELVRRLRAQGYSVESTEESNGLAVHGDEDPVVIRLFGRIR